MAAPKNGSKEHGSIEIYFAKKLANNDKKVRDRAVRRIRIWLSSKPGSAFTELDIMKLWKGLFYCMWFSDKPLVQEDLACSLAKLIHAFKDTTAVCKFVDGFFQTMGREWHGIDRLRLDKFYMLVRKVLEEIFEYIQRKEWDEEHLDAICATLSKGPCNVKTQSFPDGVRMFISEIFVDELVKVIGDNSPSNRVTCKLVDPFIELSAQSQNNLVFKSIEDEIFKKFLPEYEEDKINLEIDFAAIGSRMFEEAGKETVSTKRRKTLLRYSSLYKEAAKQHEKKQKSAEEEHANRIEKQVGNQKKGTKKRKLDTDGKLAKKEKRTKKKKEEEQTQSSNSYQEATKQEDENAANATIDGKSVEGKPAKKDRKSKRKKKENVTESNNSHQEAPKQEDESIANTTVDERNVEGSFIITASSKCQDVDMGSGEIESKVDDSLQPSDDAVVQKLDFENSFAVKDDPHVCIKGGIKKATTEKKRRKSGSKKLMAKTEETKTGLNLDNALSSNGHYGESAQSAPNSECKTPEVKKGSKKIKKAQHAISESRVMTRASSTKKKVVFELSRNAVTSISKLKVSPASVFTPDQKPVKGVLKLSTPRRKAADFF